MTINNVVLWITEVFNTTRPLSWKATTRGKETIYTSQFEENDHQYQISITVIETDGTTVHVEFDRDSKFHQTKDTTAPSTILSIIGHGVKAKLVELGIKTESNFTVLFTSADDVEEDMLDRARVYKAMMLFFARRFASNDYWYKEVKMGQVIWHVLSNRESPSVKSPDQEFVAFFRKTFL